MVKFKIKIEDLYKSLLAQRTTFWELYHITNHREKVLFKDLKTSHVRNIIKLLNHKNIANVQIELDFEMFEFQTGYNAFKLSPGQEIDIAKIEADYLMDLIY